MKATSLLRPLFAACALALAAPALAADEKMPEMPKPQSEHTWLAQFEGKWETEMECQMPDKEPMKMKSTETVRMVGGFWMISEGKGEMMGSPFTGIMTLGYDPEKKTYVGTWVDSMTSTLWNYTGTVNAEGDTLTLQSEGPCPMQGGKVCKFKEVMKITGKDTKTFTSSVLGDDGKWTQMMTATSKRVK